MLNKQFFTPQIFYYDKFKDLETVNAISQGWQNRWTYIKKGTTEAKIMVFTTPRMQFSWINYDNAIMINSSPPSGTVQLSFIRTQDICNINNRSVKEHELYIIESGEESNYLANSANEIFSIVFEKSFFHMIFFQYFGRNLKEICFNNRLPLKEEKLKLFFKKTNNLFHFIKNTKTELTNEYFFRVEEDIINHLFSLIVTKSDFYTKDKGYVEKARNILEKNVDNIYTISELIGNFNISTRALQYNFQKELGITPKQYLQDLRLNAIRKELLNAESDKKIISEIISKYGYFHPSHFTQKYRLFFGETPTQTLLNQ
jgi:AraC-like DNA-binding protein